MPRYNAPSRTAEAAAPTSQALAELRRQIDALDDAMLELVERRVAAAMGVAELKKSDPDSRLRLRPAREAAVIERLVAQAALSPERLVRQVWQEIMASCLELQVHTELVVHAVRRPAILVDAMRRRFGCAGRMTVAASAVEALDAARHREAVAVVELDPADPWWTAIEQANGLAAFECLRDEAGAPIALAIGRIAREDLQACPQIRVVGEADVPADAEVLASAGGRRLVLEAGR